MAQVTETVARGILAGQGYTDNEVRQLAHHWLASHGQAPAQAAPAAVAGPSEPTSILKRATELHEKGFMPWAEAEELALSEAGIDGGEIDELIGECGYAGLNSLLTDEDALRTFTRAVLVHQPNLEPTTQPAPQHDGEFWPVDENASRKQLIAQIGQMNFRLTALRQENAGLIKRVAGQAEALQNYRRSHETAPQQEAQEPVAWNSLTDEDRERAMNSMPDMLEGFMKTWGWLHFAKAIEAICREKNPPNSPASQGDALDAEQHEIDARHAAIYRWMLSHVADVLSIFDNWFADEEADTDELHDALAARAAQEGK